MTSEFSLSATASWERPLVDATGDTTALVVTIRAEIDRGKLPQRTPIDVAFVLDHSGSMEGAKLRLVKEAVHVALDHLSDRDRAALVVFDSQVETLHRLEAVTPETKATIQQRLDGVEANSATNLSGGWLNGCHELATESGNDVNRGADRSAGRSADRVAGYRPKRALLLTDGLANEGITDPHELIRHATELRLRGITTTAIGVGQGFDEILLSGMTEAGGGTFRYISHPRELSAFFAKEISDLLAIAAIDPRLRLTLPDGVRAHLVNAFPAHRDGKTITVDLRDMAAGDEIDLVFEIRTASGDVGSWLRPTFKLSWSDAQTSERVRYSRRLDGVLRAATRDVENAPLNDEARTVIAMERSGRTQRDAIDLDRQGRHQESREAFLAGHEMLMAAPDTATIVKERRIAASLAAEPMAPLSENIRKERVQSRMERSRGSRVDRT